MDVVPATIAVMAFPLRFEIRARSRRTNGRVGRVTTPHGSFETPAFMPVGTRASVKGLLPDQVEATGSEILLNNTYHLMLRPGSDLIARRGGVHAFMRWDRPILTDSGGYQVFSMADINRINDDGVRFKSIIDGRWIDLTPERSMAVQNELGADVIMAFDDCPPAADPAALAARLPVRTSASIAASDRRPPPVLSPAEHGRRLDQANERTARWLERCVRAHARADEQALFGIVQGGTDLDRRARSIEMVCSTDLPGYAIGGVAVGEGPEEIDRVVGFAAPRLPEDRPRYLMGVGYEHDIIRAACAGVDMFDCVLPTRNGRNSNAFTRQGTLRLRNARFAEDDAVIESDCPCPACAGGFGRAYLRHLFVAGEMLGPILCSLHNITHFQRLMVDIRNALADDAWIRFGERWPRLADHVPAPEGDRSA